MPWPSILGEVGFKAFIPSFAWAFGALAWDLVAERETGNDSFPRP